MNKPLLKNYHGQLMRVYRHYKHTHAHTHTQTQTHTYKRTQPTQPTHNHIHTFIHNKQTDRWIDKIDNINVDNINVD